MPDGVLQWIDLSTGRASVVRGSRVYATTKDEIEATARHPGARVRFDIERSNGAERAVNVRLRPGTRVSRRQRRFGTLAGARRPDEKGPAPFARPHPERGRLLQAHPLEVARVWADALAERDRDGALALYTSDAVVHHEDRDLTGRSEIGGWLEASPIFGLEVTPEIRGEAQHVVARWPDVLEVRFRIEHGLIEEQWAGEPAPDEERTVEVEGGVGPVEVAVLTRDRVTDRDVDQALEAIATSLRRVDDPVLFARVKLAMAGDPARERPATAQVSVDIDGDLVRAQVAAETMRDAINLLQRRLDDKLEQRAERLEFLRTRGPGGEPGVWRRGDLPTQRPPYFDRPPEERQLVRQKTLAMDELTVDEAAFDMDQLDFDFYLFGDLATGEDALLERLANGTYRLTRLHRSDVDLGPTAVEVEVADTEPPELTVPAAIELLDATGERYVFFANAITGRGNVVYRRYDGHYGLITPE